MRSNNEDNFCVAGGYLPEKNHGLEEIRTGSLKSGSHPILAAFDGMGGESAGETAAWLAAQEMAKEQKRRASLFGRFRSRRDPLQLSRDMNSRVCAYAAQKHIRSMGATAVYADFSEEEMTAVNIGDSRIYLLEGEKLSQVSKDHVAEVIGMYRKPPLIQFLGIPEEEMQITPHIAKRKVVPGMKVLLCSDGLTDLMQMEEIESFVKRKDEPETIVRQLKDEVLRRGAVDNTTIVLAQTENM